MMRWFRFYNDAMRNSKVAQLSDANFRLWVELLCVASENDGRIPHDEALKTVLRRRLDHLQGGLRALLKAGLIDALTVGYAPHDWDKRQYKSDVSTERSRKHREKCNVAATVNATPPDTETDADTEITAKAVSNASAFPMLDCTDPATWADFLKNRKAKRLPNTASAHRKLETDLAGMVDRTGWPPGQVFAACVAKGWGAIYDPRDRDDGISANRTNQNRGGAKDGVAAALDRRLGLDGAAGAFGRPDFGEGSGDSFRALATPKALR
jgi:hypothetical protein